MTTKAWHCAEHVKANCKCR